MFRFPSPSPTLRKQSPVLAERTASDKVIPGNWFHTIRGRCRCGRFQIPTAPFFGPLLGCLLLCAMPCYAQPFRAPRPFLPPLPPAPLPYPLVPGVPVSPIQPVAPPVTPARDPASCFQGEIHLEISEKLMQMLVSRHESDVGPVQDFISGAVVTGQQTTQSHASIDCLPSLEVAQFDFVIQGVVSSITTSSTPQADILQQGNTQFLARKRVYLNGETILTQKSMVQVMPNQLVTGAHARPTPLPMLNSLADRIAYKAALARLPESNLIAGQKVINRLQPEIDAKIDANLADVNSLIHQQVWTRLKSWNVMPDYKATFSSQERLFWDYRLGTQPLAWATPTQETQPTLPSSSVFVPDVTVRLHESLFESVASRRQLGGKTVSLNELREATDRLLLLLAEEVPAELPGLPLAITFTFDTHQPLRAEARENQLLLYLRGTFQAGTLPKTETQEIRLQITGELTEQTFTIKTSDITVRELQADGTLATPGITQTAIAAQIRTNLQPIEIKRELRLHEQLKQTLAIRLSEVQSDKGWMNLQFTANQAAPGPVENRIPSPKPTLPEAPLITPQFPPN